MPIWFNADKFCMSCLASTPCRAGNLQDNGWYRVVDSEMKYICCRTYDHLHTRKLNEFSVDISCQLVINSKIIKIQKNLYLTHIILYTWMWINNPVGLWQRASLWRSLFTYTCLFMTQVSRSMMKLGKILTHNVVPKIICMKSSE